MPNLVPNIIPIKAAEYTCKQSKYPQLYTLPTRSLILGPSGTGKSVLLVNMLLDIYIEDASQKFTSSLLQSM